MNDYNNRINLKHNLIIMFTSLRSLITPHADKAPGPKFIESKLETHESSFHLNLNYPLKLLNEYGEVVRLPGLHNKHLINAPELIGPILQNQEQWFTRNNRFYNSLRKLLGTGLLTSDDAQWKQSRKSFQAAFHRHILENYAPILYKNTQSMLKNWTKTDKKIINATQDVYQLAFDNALNALFNYSNNNKKKYFSSKINSINQDFNKSYSTLIPSWKLCKLKLHQYQLNKLVKTFIDENETCENPSTGLMQHFFALYPQYNHKKLRARAFSDLKTLLLSGSETTGCVLNWAIYCLAICQDKQNKLRLELQQQLGEKKNPTLTELNQCVYLTAVIKEVLRLYPPIWHTWRKTKSDLYFGRYRIPKQAHLLINFYVLHRHPLYWKEPDRFLPERFLSEEKIERFTYLPFGAGAHQCIASQFAMFEVKIILAELFKNNQITLTKTTNVVPSPKITLHSDTNIKIQFKLANTL